MSIWTRGWQWQYNHRSYNYGTKTDDIYNRPNNRDQPEAAAWFMAGGNDVVVGYRTAHNVLIGGRGHDKLTGGDVGDILVGGPGADIMRGRGGSDVFYFSSVKDAASRNGKSDLIADFDDVGSDQDFINLTYIDAKEGVEGNNMFRLVKEFTGREGQLDTDYIRGSNRTTISGDVDGDGMADFTVFLKGKFQLGADDIGL